MSTDIETLASVCAEGGCKDSAAFEQLQTYILTSRYSRIEGVDIPTVAASFTAKEFTSPRKIEQVRQYLDLMIENSPDGYLYNNPSASDTIYLDTVTDTKLRIGAWQYLTANTDCIIAQIESDTHEIQKSIAVAAGDTVTIVASGTIQSIQLSSGTMTLYRSANMRIAKTDFTWTCAPAGSAIKYTTTADLWMGFVVPTIKIAQDETTPNVVDLTITDSVIRAAMWFNGTPFVTINFSNLDTQEYVGNTSYGLFVFNNANLTTLGLSNVHALRGQFYIGGNTLLTSINCPRLYSILWGGIYITFNAALTEILLPALESMLTGEVFINNNALLTTIDFSSLLDMYWGFNVYSNASLTSLDLSSFSRTNMANETRITDVDLAITNNPLLNTITIDDSFYPVNNSRIDLTGNALSATIVNRFVYYSNVALGYGGYLVPGGLVGFQLLMAGGTNSAPTGIYNTLVFVLRTYGATISTN